MESLANTIYCWLRNRQQKLSRCWPRNHQRKLISQLTHGIIRNTIYYWPRYHQQKLLKKKNKVINNHIIATDFWIDNNTAFVINFWIGNESVFIDDFWVNNGCVCWWIHVSAMAVISNRNPWKSLGEKISLP
jgi:hypothetical protein